LVGAAVSCPWAGEDDGEGDGEGDDDPDDDEVGVEGLGWPGVAPWLVVGVSASTGEVVVAFTATVLRPGEEAAAAEPGAVADMWGETPPPSATVVALAGCELPAISSVAIPAARTVPATATTAAAAWRRRRTCCHHAGPGGTTGFGNPVCPNDPA
jgi:hypothetical protein